MSLKSRKSIDIAGSDKHVEVSVSFCKNPDGTYTKIVNETTRDWKNNQIRQGKSKPLKTGPYILTTSANDADEIWSYEDIDETTKYMYFKLLELDALQTTDDV